MNKNKSLILLIVIGIIGSIINFYATNLLFSDLSNMFYGVHDAYIISSFPIFFIALDFVVAFIFVLRITRYPVYKKSLINLYTIYGIVNSILGIVFAIITGTVIYDSLLAPYPFKGYSLIMLIIHLALCALLIYLNIKARKLEDDTEKKKIKFKYVIYSIILGGLVYFAFNKFGAVIWSITYMQIRSFVYTFPFYLFLLLPTFVLINVVAYFFDEYEKNSKTQMVYMGILFILNIVLVVAIIIIANNNTAFISAISPALALERLATKPINIIFQFITMFLMTAYYMVYAVITYKKEK